jgi:lia operon protein LiaG
MRLIKIIQLFLWLLIIAFLVTVLIGFTFGKWNFSHFIKSEKQIELLQQTANVEDISNINLDIHNADVVIQPSDTNEVVINYKGPESLLNKPDITVSTDNGQLTVVQQNDFIFPFFHFWNFSSRVLTISLPESYSKVMDMSNNSGSLTITGDYSLASFKSITTSGDVSIKALACTDFSLDSTSGNVTLGDIGAQKLKIALTSGQMKADSLAGNGSISCISGDVRIKSFTGDASISATSGNISVISFSGSGSISCLSGNIDVAAAKSTGDLSVKTGSGNVDFSIGRDITYKIDANCTSGDISSNFPLSFSDSGRTVTGQIGSGTPNHLSVRTTAGDIHLTA